ncbi:MAG: phospho-N-acetylmuramoyl-pentapeptide-transferase [Clostridia bacterium]|nr:phospho-N-acetylmuramoyl-pentapeptide-transferase [Clostridia bacterium]
MDFTPVIAALTAFAICAASGKIVIPFLHKLKFGQTILDIGPKWHQKKQGTPTMGGIMIFLGFAAGIAVALTFGGIFSTKISQELKYSANVTRFVAGVALAVGMGLIGFFDDYIKVVKKRNLGLTAKQKTFLQLFVSAAYLSTLYLSGVTTTWLPFVGDVSVISGLGIIFWPIALMFIYGFTNAVNLTDGIDGLAASVTMVVSCGFILASGYLSNCSYNIISCALAGACMGFLIWNFHPARVFMGDTGSMFLGGAVIALSFGIGRPVLLLLAGIVYLLEAFSVMLQVAVFKKTGKRIFKMSPIHHHFEMSGWSEEKIVLIFSFVALLGFAVSFLLIIL